MKKLFLMLLVMMLIINIATSVNLQEKDMKIKVSGYSMYPTLKPGEELECKATSQIKNGDIVVYSTGNQFIIHRIVGKIGPYFILKGDNNPIIDPHLVSRSSIICKVSL